jgi:hypothetical protein
MLEIYNGFVINFNREALFQPWNYCRDEEVNLTNILIAILK